MGLTAFWFPYTAPLADEIEFLEIYRYFRNTAFDSVDGFYLAFDEVVQNGPWGEMVRDGLRQFDPEVYLREYPFYSHSDRRFRFIRDRLLGEESYRLTMDALIEAKGFDIAAATRNLWFDADCLKKLLSDGHVIGLHSHSHPTDLAAMTEHQQRAEYEKCKGILEDISGSRIDVMSHPNGSYGDYTLEMLKELGIGIGFRSNMAMTTHGPLEYPRIDHTTLRNRCGV